MKDKPTLKKRKTGICICIITGKVVEVRAGASSKILQYLDITSTVFAALHIVTSPDMYVLQQTGGMNHKGY